MPGASGHTISALSACLDLYSSCSLEAQRTNRRCCCVSWSSWRFNAVLSNARDITCRLFQTTHMTLGSEHELPPLLSTPHNVRSTRTLSNRTYRMDCLPFQRPFFPPRCQDTVCERLGSSRGWTCCNKSLLAEDWINLLLSECYPMMLYEMKCADKEH